MTTLRDANGDTVEVVTEADLRGWLARWLLGFAGGSILTGALLLIWVVRFDAREQTHHDTQAAQIVATESRLSHVDETGTQPLKAIRSELDSLRFEMRALIAELRRAR